MSFLDVPGIKPAPPPTGVAATDTANLQAFHNALPAKGGVIRLAAGDYAINVNSLVITKPVKITGAGAGYGTGVMTEPTVSGGSRMVVNSLTGIALDIQADGCVLEDFAVVNTTTGTPTAGAGIRFTSATHMRMRNVTVSNFWVNVDLDSLSGWYWTIADCMILDPVKYGIWLRNMEPTGDWADPSIHGTTLTNYRADRTPDAMLQWESGGGVRFQNNKVNTGPASGGLQGKCAVGLNFAVADAVTTGVFTIGGNSLENCTSAMIQVTQRGPSNTGDVAGIVIVGNEIAFGYSTCTGIRLMNPGPFGKVRNVVIDGNQFAMLPNGSVSLSNMTGVTIGINQHNEITGAPVISIGQGCQDIQVVAQTVRNTAGPVTLIQNLEELNNLNPKGPFQNIDHVYSRALPAVTNLAAPVLSAPTTATTGGTLAAATYFYKATYTNVNGETVGSNEISQATTGTTSTTTFTIGAAPAGATGTKVYRSTTTGTEVLLDTLATTPTTYTDNGSKTPGAATVPTVNTTSLVTLWKFSHAAYSGGLFTLDIGGGISGVGSLSKRLVRSYFREGGIDTLAAVGTDVAVGAGALDVQFDVTTVPGEVAVQVKLPTGSTGTDAAARATLAINGTVGKVVRT